MGKITCFVCVALAGAFGANAATYDASTGYVTLLVGGTNSGDMPITTNAVKTAKGEYFWSDHLALHAGTNYYANLNFRSFARASTYSAITYPVPCNRFVLHNATMNYKCGYPSKMVFENEGIFVVGKASFLINADNCLLGGVAGTMTVQETSASTPFTWATCTSGYPTPGHGFRVEAKIVGDENQVMRITTPADHSGRVYFMGDMSEYLGTINTISNLLYAGSSLLTKAVNATKGGEVSTCGAAGASISIPNVTLDATSAIGCAATNAFEVGTLSLGDGATVRGFVSETGASGCVTVTDSFTAAGKIRITLDMPIDGATGDVTRVAVLRVAKTAGAFTREQLEFGERSRLAGVTPSALPEVTALEVVDEGEWTVAYATWRQVIRQIEAVTSAATAGTFNLATTWSNGKTPAENAGQDFYSSLNTYLPKTFPGRTFTTTTSIVLHNNGSYAFSNLTMNAGQLFRMWPGGTITFNVPITVNGTSSQALTWTLGQRTTIKHTRPIMAAATQIIGIRAPSSSSDWGCCSCRLSADNTDSFSGKWIVRYLTPAQANPTQYMAFAVCEQANLGKPFPAFTFDALKVENWQSLEPDAEDVVLDDPTRGVWLEGNAQLISAAGRSLTLASPVTWAGTVRKSGPGALVLASPLKPRYVGADQVAEPVAGTNVLKVVEGGLKVSTTNAVDGLALVFGAGGKLLLDLEPADASLKDWGVYDVKWAAPFSLADGAEGIPVAFADADETPPATVFTRAVATVPSDQANAVKGMLRMPRPWKSYDSTLSVRDNGNNTSTILATYRPSGMTVIFR